MLSIELLAELALLMAQKGERENLPDACMRFAFEDVMVSVTSLFDLEAFTFTFQDELYGIYADFEAFQVTETNITYVKDEAHAQALESYLQTKIDSLKLL